MKQSEEILSHGPQVCLDSSRYNGMRKIFRVYALPLSLLTLLMTFNNCSGYQQAKTSSDTGASVSCTNATCISRLSDNLKVTAHLGNGEYAVPAALADFNLGGDCNEAGYPFNTVRWELRLNGVVVRHSGMSNTGNAGSTGTLTAASRCNNGRFFLYIKLAALGGGTASQDPVDRTGLKTGVATPARSAYDLYIEVVGQTSVGGTAIQGSQGKIRVPLVAI